MGYSCTAIADRVLEFILNDLNKNVGNGTSNGWFNNGDKYFFERGRENDDGAITGQIFLFRANDCWVAGSVRIEPNGKITRFNQIPLSLRKVAGAKLQAGKFGSLYSQPA